MNGKGNRLYRLPCLQHKSNSYVVLLEPLFMRRLHNWLVVSILCPSRTIYGKLSCLKFTMSPDGKNGWFPAGWYLTWQTHSLHVKQIRVTWFWVSVYLSGESRLWLKVKNDNESGNLDLSDFVSYLNCIWFLLYLTNLRILRDDYISERWFSDSICISPQKNYVILFGQSIVFMDTFTYWKDFSF